MTGDIQDNNLTGNDNSTLRSRYQRDNAQSTATLDDPAGERIESSGAYDLPSETNFRRDESPDERLANNNLAEAPLASQDLRDPAVKTEQRLSYDSPAQLFPDKELNDLRARWDKTQSAFVDEPRAAVKDADNLVAAVVTRITEQFTAERTDLERQWDRGGEVSTEDLRQALRRYRMFFDRLLTF